LLALFILFSCTNTKESKEKKRNSKDSATVSRLLKQLKEVSLNNIDSMVFLAEKYELRLKNKVKPKQFAEYHKLLGMMYYQKSEYKLASESFVKSRQTLQNEGDNIGAAKLTSNLAALEEIMGNYDNSIELYMQALHEFETNSSNPDKPVSFIYNNLGIVYVEMGSIATAIDYYKKSLAIKLKSGDSASAASTLNNIGVAFEELEGNADSALHYYYQAQQIFNQLGNVFFCAKVKNNIGQIFTEKKQFDQAAENLNAAFAIFDSISNKQGQADVLRNLGEMYFLQRNDDKAIGSLQQALLLSTQLNNKKGSLEISELLSKVFVAIGRSTDAIPVLMQYNALKDSLIDENKQKAIAEMEAKYQLDKKDERLEMFRLKDELNKKRIKSQTIFIVFLVILLILIIVLMHFNMIKNKMQQRQIRLELENYLYRCEQLSGELDAHKQSSEKSHLENFSKHNLSARESEVLLYISKGYRNAEISEKLFVSQNTIKTHIKNIYQKLEVKNRVEALKKVDVMGQ
jgi:DNA-binding CsgD family transcriptional regulator/tetratricopeptide (TPR) repeat protein